MQRSPRSLRSVTTWLLFAGVAAAHGGSYTGPPSGGTPGYGGPGGGTTPGGRGGGTTPGGGKAKSSEPSALDWVFWWEMNRDRFLDLKRVVRGTAEASVSGDTVLGAEGKTRTSERLAALALAAAVEPALMRGLRDPWWDTQASSVIALGKVSEPTRDDLAATITVLLHDPRQEVRESAGLALGILGAPGSVPLLLSIYRNEPAAQALFENRDISSRQRSFAAMAIGLIGARHPEAVDASTLAELVKGASTPSPAKDLRVGPAIALGLIRTEAAVPALCRLAADSEQDDDVRAHLIVALGKVGACSAIPYLVTEGLSDAKNTVRRSSAIALGLLASRDDKASVEKLIQTATGSPDRMTRNFAIMALAESGSLRGRDALVQFATKGTGYDRTFGALACGVYGFKWRESEQDLGKVLLEEFKNVRGDEDRAAFALALGLLDYGPATEAFVAELRGAGSPETKGFVCIAFGLMRRPKDAETLTLIRAQLKQTADLGLLRRAAVGVGLCRDAAALADLETIVRDASNNLPSLDAAATALGMIGGRSAVECLSRIVENKDGSFVNNARAFAAVGLGILADKDSLSIMSRIREHSNFASPTPALAEALAIY